MIPKSECGSGQLGLRGGYCTFVTRDIGKDDRGEVVGVENAEKLLRDIPNKVRDILGILVAVNLRTKAGKEFLEIVVEPYPSPISYPGLDRSEIQRQPPIAPLQPGCGERILSRGSYRGMGTRDRQDYGIMPGSRGAESGIAMGKRGIVG